MNDLYLLKKAAKFITTKYLYSFLWFLAGIISLMSLVWFVTLFLFVKVTICGLHTIIVRFSVKKNHYSFLFCLFIGSLFIYFLREMWLHTMFLTKCLTKKQWISLLSKNYTISAHHTKASKLKFQLVKWHHCTDRKQLHHQWVVLVAQLLRYLLEQPLPKHNLPKTYIINE